jgi:type IV pilus assembly protein PilE
MRRLAGFTLIELMVVVAVVAILAAIALPSFAEQVRKSRRAEARSGMSQIQLLQERWRAERPTYATDEQLRGKFGGAIFTSENGKWTFSVGDAVTATGYTITASPAGGHSDSACATGFTLTVNGSAVTKSPAACWQ